MLSIKNRQIKLTDPTSIIHITIFDKKGNCLYVKASNIKKCIDLSHLNIDSGIIVMNTNSGDAKTAIISIN